MLIPLKEARLPEIVKKVIFIPIVFQVKPWLSSTVPSVWTCTLQSRHGTITLTAPTLAPASLTCSSWCTQSTGQSAPPISLFQGNVHGTLVEGEGSVQWTSLCLDQLLLIFANINNFINISYLN
jgi:hypothetical protein